MSLGTWFRDYVYIPLGGSRCSKARNLLNIFIVWMLTGFWHGAEWNFIVWGLYFGILLTLEKTFLLKWLEKYRVLGHIYILVLGIISFVIFDSVNLAGAAAHIGAMFGAGNLPLMTEITKYYLSSFGIIFLIAVIGATPAPKYVVEKLKENKAMATVLNVLEPLVMIVLLTVATGYLIDGSFNPFLYFRF